MTKRRIIPALLTAAALGLGATAAWAEQPANADMQKQLEALQQQIKDLQAQKVSNPAFTASYVGFVNGDTTNVLTGSPDLSTQADTNSPTGVSSETSHRRRSANRRAGRSGAANRPGSMAL